MIKLPSVENSPLKKAQMISSLALKIISGIRASREEVLVKPINLNHSLTMTLNIATSYPLSDLYDVVAFLLNTTLDSFLITLTISASSLPTENLIPSL